MVNVEPTLTWLPLLPALLAPVSISGTNLLAYEVNASNAIRAGLNYYYLAFSAGARNPSIASLLWQISPPLVANFRGGLFCDAESVG